MMKTKLILASLLLGALIINAACIEGVQPSSSVPLSQDDLIPIVIPVPTVIPSPIIDTLPAVEIPSKKPHKFRVDTKPSKVVSLPQSGPWSRAEVSWYGPGLYGNGTACGQKYTKEIVGVAHLHLKCGTKVAFRYKGVTVIARVIDRGPYVAGRLWDLSHGLCKALHHCFTGDLSYRILK